MRSPDPSSTSKLDVKIIASFVDAVRSVFRTMVKVETQTLKPYFKVSPGDYNVFGIIGFSGELTGVVTLSLTRATAENLVEAFAGVRLEYETADFSDAVGELANMIAGCAKSELELNTSITVPTVIMGNDCHLAVLRNVPCVVIPCISPRGDFAVEVCIKQTKAS